MKYSDPYASGVALGLVLLAAYAFAGRGLGASGAFAASASGTVAAVAPEYAASNPYFGRYLARPGGPWREWLLVEIAGVAIGAFASAALSGRFRVAVERGRGVTVRARIATALAGGTTMGVGAALARGCTSGQALTGGALLSVGSWTFMMSAFAAGYVVAPAIKRAWQ
ncbi:MAG TPA: YeeE/YedE thiosulfate transporter family protein [Vicinamibacterales bacterium]|jgi:hypothetical protein|nr:YeeE/YedE thiosulfate transporter family protein [Vicinamibacterales bacterium]